ncbi:hypothetical protein BOVAC2_1622 [Bacteroides ovatus]|nr:hypothetical protein BOVAC2_1622 [Bacteroides ovatus]
MFKYKHVTGDSNFLLFNSVTILFSATPILSAVFQPIK